MFGVSPHYLELHVCSTRSGSVVWCVAVCSEGGNGVAEDSWNAHIGYLEDEVKRIDERADKLEATIPLGTQLDLNRGSILLNYARGRL